MHLARGERKGGQRPVPVQDENALEIPQERFARVRSRELLSGHPASRVPILRAALGQNNKSLNRHCTLKRGEKELLARTVYSLGGQERRGSLARF